MLLTSKLGTKLEEEKEQTTEKRSTYWDAQVRAIASLKNIGVVYKIEDRIEPMKCIRKIYKLAKNPNLIQPQLAALAEAMNAVTTIVAWRTNGFEPKHDGKKYIK